MNKIILFLLSMILCCGMNATNVQAQTSVLVQAIATIVNRNDIKVNYVKSAFQIVPNGNTVSGNSIDISYENGKLVNNTILNLGSLSITVENKNSFSVSLPSQAVILKNSKNTNTLQMVGWRSSVQPFKNEFKKNSWVVNYGAFLKMGSVDDNPAGVYSGTYPVTFVYD